MIRSFFTLILLLAPICCVSAQEYCTLLVIDSDDGTLTVEGVEVFQGDKFLGKTNHVGVLKLTSKVKGTLTLKHPDYQPLTVKAKFKKGASVELAMMVTDEIYQLRKREHEAVIYDRSCEADSVKSSYLKNTLKQDGTTPLDTFIQAAIHYPKRAFAVGLQGTVTARVYIEADGSLSCIVITKSVSYELDKEAYRVLSLMSGWEPARKNGVPVASVSEIDVKFVIEQ